MNRALLIGILAAALFLVGVAAVRGEVLLLALPLLAYLLGGLATAPHSPIMEVERTLSVERADADVPTEVTVRVTNRGEAADELLLEDTVPAGLRIAAGSPRHLVNLQKGGVYSFVYAVSGQRGRYSFQSLRATSSGGLGLLAKHAFFPASGQLLVLPLVRRLKYVAIRPRRTRVFAGSIPARIGGPGTEFFGVRSYAPGDPMRAMNWRANARHPDQLFANDFQQERVADVGIVLDGRERTNVFPGGHSMFEYSVQAAAALGEAFLQQGNRVGLLSYGSYLEWSFPGYGKRQRERLLHALAQAQVGDSTVFAGLDHLSPRMFPVESQIVLISPLIADDLKALVSLRSRGYQVFVLTPDPVAFEARLLPARRDVDLAVRIARLERRLLLRRLQRASIQVLEWDVQQPFDQAVGPALARLRFPRQAGWVQ